MSSSSSGRMSDNDHEMDSTSTSSSHDNQPYSHSDPLSFLNALAQDGLLSAVSHSSISGENQTYSNSHVSQEAQFHEWTTPGLASDANTGCNPASQLDLSMLTPDDFNYMDTNDLLNIDTMLFSDEFLSSNPPMSCIADPVNSTSLPYDMDTFLNSLSSMNDIPYPSSSSGLTQSPEEQQSPVFVPGQQTTVARPLGSLGFQDIEELSAQAVTSNYTGVNTYLQSNKLPIPRMQNRASGGSSSKRMASIVPRLSEQAETSPAPSSESMNPHQKLSHSTVERRYRSNLKVLLKNLREEVPALRCLELKTGNRVSNLSLKSEIRRVGVDVGSDAEGEDVIDARGYIDGVKVSHNGSKTTAIVKAIEYLRVLKRRVLRLKREQEGLKSLVRSMIEGPELLKQWETMWREQNGGPEKDEIDAEESKASKADQCDNSEEESAEESDDKEDQSVSGQERSRKRVKVTKKNGKKASVSPGEAHPLQTQSRLGQKLVPILPVQPISEPSAGPSMSAPVQLEKRKRGRPRKVPLPPVVVSNELVKNALLAQQQRTASNEPPLSKSTAEPTPMHSPAQHPEIRSEQYLLAAFAFFSFFNFPISISPTSSAWTDRQTQQRCPHFGTVMGPGTYMASNITDWTSALSVSSAMGWRDAMQLAQLILSIFMLFSFMRSRFLRLAELASKSSKIVSRRISSLVHRISPPPAIDPKAEEKVPGDKLRLYVAARKLRVLRANGIVELEEEGKIYREGLGVKTGFRGLLSLLYRQIVPRKSSDSWQLERRAFSRLAEIVALDRNSSPLRRIQTFYSLIQFSPRCTSSATEVATAALVLYPIWISRSEWLWRLAIDRVRGKSALSPHIYKAYESFVLESMSIAEASSNLLRLDLKAGARSVNSIICDGQKAEYEAAEQRRFQSPIALIAKQAVHDYVREYAEELFIQVVSGGQMELAGYNGFVGYDREMDRVLAAGRSLNKAVVALMDLFDQVCNVNTKRSITDMPMDMDLVKEACCAPTEKPGIDAIVNAELKSLLYAIALYRRIFPTSNGSVAEGYSSGVGTRSASPTLSSVNTASKQRVLKLCLDSSAFDRSEGLRKARSQVIDRLTLL